MIIGDATPATEETPAQLFERLERERRASNPPAQFKLPDVPPLAAAVVPALVVGLVDRQKHPIVWWLFGTFPLGLAIQRAISQRRIL